MSFALVLLVHNTTDCVAPFLSDNKKTARKNLARNGRAAPCHIGSSSGCVHTPSHRWLITSELMGHYSASWGSRPVGQAPRLLLLWLLIWALPQLQIACIHGDVLPACAWSKVVRYEEGSLRLLSPSSCFCSKRVRIVGTTCNCLHLAMGLGVNVHHQAAQK